MWSVLQKPIFWFIFLVLITSLFIFLTFLVARNKNQPLAAKKPGSCLILEEKYCSQATERKPVMINGVEYIYVVFHNTSEKSVPVFVAEDGTYLNKVTDSGAPFSGIRAMVLLPFPPGGGYDVRGDLEVDNMIQVKDPKKGSVAGYAIPGGTVYITKNKRTPDGPRTDEEQLKRLFRLK